MKLMSTVTLIASLSFIMSDKCEAYTFHTRLQESVKERRKLTSFHFDYTRSTHVNSQSTEPGSLPLMIQFEERGLIMCDEFTHTLIWFKVKKLVDVQGKDSEVQRLKKLFEFPHYSNYVQLDELVVSNFSDRNENDYEPQKLSEADKNKLPLVFRSIGLSPLADISLGLTIEESVKNIISQTKDHEPVKVEGELETFNYDNMTIDKARGNWVTEIKAVGSNIIGRNPSTGKPIKRPVIRFSSSMKLAKVGSHWVPTKMSLISNGLPDTFELNWKSAGELIDPTSIDLEKLKIECQEKGYLPSPKTPPEGK